MLIASLLVYVINKPWSLYVVKLNPAVLYRSKYVVMQSIMTFTVIKFIGHLEFLLYINKSNSTATRVVYIVAF